VISYVLTTPAVSTGGGYCCGAVLICISVEALL
jgi:hypothetical protein